MVKIFEAESGRWVAAAFDNKVLDRQLTVFHELTPETRNQCVHALGDRPNFHGHHVVQGAIVTAQAFKLLFDAHLADGIWASGFLNDRIVARVSLWCGRLARTRLRRSDRVI